jgi:methionyl-tRNA formyltransferase
MISIKRVVFMGTPQFSVAPLIELNNHYDVVAVYSQPPRPKGRGHHVIKSPVHEQAEALGLPVFTPKNFKLMEDRQQLMDLKPDIIVVAAYGLILPQSVLDIAPLGCINIHASLLPMWRGAAPIHYALLNGDQQTGITIMQMDAGLDTGPILMMESTPIDHKTSFNELHDTMSMMGTALLMKTLSSMEDGMMESTPQPAIGHSYAHKLNHEHGHLNFKTMSSGDIDLCVRALASTVGCWFVHEEIRFKVHNVSIIQDGNATPGMIMDNHLTIGCADGHMIQINVIQKPGGRAMSREDFLHGHPVNPGQL